MLIPYITVFLLNLFGGGIATFGVGAALQVVHLNVALVCIVIVAADTVSDTFYYVLGRFGTEAARARFLKRGGKSAHRFTLLKGYYDKHGKMTVFLGKMSDVLAIPAVTVAGAVKMRFLVYLALCIGTSLLKTLLLLGAGYLLGKSTNTADAHFIFYGIAGLFLVALVVFVARYFYISVTRASKR